MLIVSDTTPMIIDEDGAFGYSEALIWEGAYS